MPVLITGCAGFIGSHVCEALVAARPTESFVGLDKLDVCASEANLARVAEAPNFRFEHGDITDAARLRYLLQRHRIDTVFHFAAESHVDNSFGNSLSFTLTNVLGTHTLLESCRTHAPQLKLFVHVSTDEVYGTRDEAQHEHAMLDPTNPYAASKAAAEQLVRAYWHSYRLPVIITRSNNIYGPRQFPEKLIPKFIERLRRGEACCVHGDGQQLRSFLYVDDVTRAFELIWTKGTIGETYNIGTEEEVSVLEVAQRLIALSGASSNSCIEHVRDRAFNDLRYRISSAKVRALGWAPQVDFEAGLRQTVAWYLEHSAAEHWAGFDEKTLRAHPTK